MSPAPVPDQGDQKILPEVRAVRRGESDRRQARDGIVGIDVHDRYLETFGQVARIERRTAFARAGREAELVVGDDVERPASAIAGQTRQVERLGHDSLARKRRVAMNEHSQR